MSAENYAALRKVPLLYILADDGRTPTTARSVVDWGQWMERATADGSRVVAHSQIDGAEIITLFQGINRAQRNGAPRGLFEIVIYYPSVQSSSGSGPLIGPWRYDTWSEALAAHSVMVERLRKNPRDTPPGGQPTQS